MVFVKKENKMLPRRTFTGKLIRSETEDSAQVEPGKFRFVDLLLLANEDKPKPEQEWLRVRYYPEQGGVIDYNDPKLAEFKRADERLSTPGGDKPVVTISFYTTKKVGVDKNGTERIFSNHKGSIVDLAKLHIEKFVPSSYSEPDPSVAHVMEDVV